MPGVFRKLNTAFVARTRPVAAIRIEFARSGHSLIPCRLSRDSRLPRERLPAQQARAEQRACRGGAGPLSLDRVFRLE
jgi:hypothetical protein